MIMNRKLALRIFFALCILVTWLYFPVFNMSFSSGGNPVDFSQPTRKETFSVSQYKDEPPLFTEELTIDPFRVKEGERQYFSIWVKDPSGVEKVMAKVTTDKGEENFNFQLVKGTKENGQWLGFWETRNISLNEMYPTEISAQGKKGGTTKLTCFWYTLK